MPQAALVIGAVIAVAGTAVQVSAQRKAAKAQKKRAGVQRRESIRRSIRQTQRQRAQAIAAAEIRGAGDSSGAFGGIGSLSSQLGQDIGFTSQIGEINNDISRFNSRAALGAGISSVGGFIAGNSKGIGEIGESFKSFFSSQESTS